MSMNRQSYWGRDEGCLGCSQQRNSIGMRSVSRRIGGAVLFGLILPFVSPGQPGPCVPPPPGMVAWYPLDEQAGATTVQDIAAAPFSTINDFGNTQPGPVQSGGPMAVVGKVGAGALYFFGPHIQVPHSADLNFPSGLSIDAWIRVVDCGHGSGGVWAPIVDKWDPATQTGFSFFVDQPAPATGFLKL